MTQVIRVSECNASQSVSSVKSEVTEYKMLLTPAEITRELPHLGVLQYQTFPVIVVCTTIHNLPKYEDTYSKLQMLCLSKAKEVIIPQLFPVV